MPPRGGSGTREAIVRSLRSAREGGPEEVREAARVLTNFLATPPAGVRAWLPEETPERFFGVDRTAAGEYAVRLPYEARLETRAPGANGRLVIETPPTQEALEAERVAAKVTVKTRYERLRQEEAA